MTDRERDRNAARRRLGRVHPSSRDHVGAPGRTIRQRSGRLVPEFEGEQTAREILEPAGYRLVAMLGEQEAVVLAAKPFELHDMTHYEVTLGFPDQTVEHVRLGPRGHPG